MLGSASLCLSIGPHLTRRALVSQGVGVLGGVPDVLSQVVEPIFLRTGRLGPRAEDATQSVTHRLLECQEAVVLALPPRIARRRGARLPSAARPACGVLRVVSPRAAPLAVSACIYCVLHPVFLWSREEYLHPVHSKTAAEPIRTEPAGAADIL